jgi:hypothetical protein
LDVRGLGGVTEFAPFVGSGNRFRLIRRAKQSGPYIYL